MRAKEYPLFVRCLEEGITAGLHKCFKREYLKPVDDQNDSLAVDQISQYVLNEVCEAFNFDDGGDP